MPEHALVPERRAVLAAHLEGERHLSAALGGHHGERVGVEPTGAGNLRNWTVTAAQTMLGRPFNSGIDTVSLIEPGTVFGDRVNQVDVRVAKTFASGQTRIRGSLDLYNAFNSNAILTLNTTYGSSWLRPTSTMPGRLIKFGIQIDY